MDSFDEDSLNENDQTRGPHSVTKKRKLKSNSPLNNTKKKFTKRSKNKTENKPPTIEELNNLKMTENLFNNNLFRLQIEELIKEVAIKEKRRNKFNNWLENLKKTLSEIQEFEFEISELENKKTKKILRNLAKIQCPFQCDNDNMKILLKKPYKVQSFGLYENSSQVGPKLEANIMIIMPKECFQAKDYLNNRYLVKKYYYLNYISEKIDAFKKEIQYFNHNLLLPVLNLQPDEEDEKFTVKMFVVPQEETFKPSRFLPNINNVKKDLFGLEIEDSTAFQASTIFYNSALNFDVTLEENCKFFQDKLAEQTNIQEGIKLLIIWLEQRDFHVGFGAFCEEYLISFMVYLMAKKKINKLMSSYQIVRNFWSFFTQHDLEKCPITLEKNPGINIEYFQKEFKLIFLDTTGCYNIVSFLNLEIYRKIKNESKIALEYLDNNANISNNFHLLFITKLPFSLQYDAIININSEEIEKLAPQSNQDKIKTIGYQNVINFQENLIKYLEKALNKRAIHIVPRLELDLVSGKCVRILAGINLNPNEAFKFIELGPELSDKKNAEEFREFWDYLSSDRRFRDGSAHTAIYFKTSTIRGKRAIIKRILKFVLIEKLRLNCRIFYDELEEFIIKNRNIIAPYPVGTNEEGCLKIIQLSDELGKILRNAKISLHISGIQAINDSVCYTDVFPPYAHKFNTSMYSEAINFVIFLEQSSKWPNNLQAINYLKLQFFLDISTFLKENFHIISRITKEYLEISYKGLFFRYSLYIPKEIAILKREITQLGSVKYEENIYSKNYEISKNIVPKILGALKGIQMEFPTFGPTTALIKRFLRAHLLDNYYFSDIIINLLSGVLFKNFGNSILTPQLGFLRFLKFFAEFQWELQPIILNFNDELSREDLLDLESQFQKNRTFLQDLYIITPFDKGQSVFTEKGAPKKEILSIIRLLARGTLNLLESRILNENLFNLIDLFKPNLDGYNLLIHLDSALNPRKYEEIDCNIEEIIKLKEFPAEKVSGIIPDTNFNPVELYLEELRRSFGYLAEFFHDFYGGSIIGVIWTSSAKEVKEFKVGNSYARILNENQQLILNYDALVEDFYILGKGLVKWIEKK